MVEGHIELYKSEYAGLAFGFEVNPESCSNHGHYEFYIRFTAITDHVSGRGTTFVFLNDDESKILGYITLRSNAFIHKYDRGMEGEPAIEILELAVSKDFERKGVATALFQYAATIAQHVNEKYMGVRYMVVCADKPAEGFYRKMEFERIEEQGEIPRDNWNDNCTPMFIRLPDIAI